MICRISEMIRMLSCNKTTNFTTSFMDFFLSLKLKITFHFIDDNLWLDINIFSCICLLMGFVKGWWSDLPVLVIFVVSCPGVVDDIFVLEIPVPVNFGVLCFSAVWRHACFALAHIRARSARAYNLPSGGTWTHWATCNPSLYPGLL